MHYYVLWKVYQGFNIFFTVLQYALFAYCIMSWFASPTNRLYILLSRIAQPLVAPFRTLSARLIQKGLRIDLSVIFAFLAIYVAQGLIGRLFGWLMTL